MKFVLLAIALFLSCIAAINSGIFEDDRQTVSQPPGVEEAEVERRGAPSVPTTSRRQTNAERLRRGLSPSPVKEISFPQTVQPATTDSTYLNGLIEITAVDGPDSNYPLFGAVGGSGGYNFNTGNVGYAYLAGAGHITANSPPSFSAGHSIQAMGYNAPSESTIWKVDRASGSITVQWVNTDGCTSRLDHIAALTASTHIAKPSTSIFHDPAIDFVGLVGDFAKFVQTFPSESASLVTLTFVPGQ